MSDLKELVGRANVSRATPATYFYIDISTLCCARTGQPLSLLPSLGNTAQSSRLSQVRGRALVPGREREDASSQHHACSPSHSAAAKLNNSDLASEEKEEGEAQVFGPTLVIFTTRCHWPRHPVHKLITKDGVRSGVQTPGFKAKCVEGEEEEEEATVAIKARKAAVRRRKAAVAADVILHGLF